MKLSKLILSVLTILVLGLVALPASAATTTTTTFSVTATVQGTCTVTATNLAFGNYTSTAALAGSSTVSVTCTNGSGYTLALDGGQSGVVTARAMKYLTNSLSYGLYTDAAHTTNFATLATTTGNGAAQTTTVYGLIPSGQYVTPATYTDTITATVSY